MLYDERWILKQTANNPKITATELTAEKHNLQVKSYSWDSSRIIEEK